MSHPTTTSLKNNRIAFLFGDNFPCGGTERTALDFAEFTDEFEVFVLCRSVSENHMPKDTRVRIILLSQRNKTRAGLKEMVDVICQNHIGVLVNMMSVHPQIGEIRRQTGVRVVWAHHSVPFWEGIHKNAVRLRLREGGLWDRLRWRFHYRSRVEERDIYTQRALRDYRATLTQVDAMTVLCEEYRQQIVDALRLDASEAQKISVVPNYERPVALPRLDKEKVVLFVGRLSYGDKRVDRLIKIWDVVGRQHPDWRLVIVGSGPEEARLRVQARATGLENIVFEGWQSRTEPYYRQASIVCLTSTYEGMPLCFTEGQAHGVIPVAFDATAGFRRIIDRPGENGVLVPPFDVEAYARELHLLMDDAQRRARMQAVVLEKKYPQAVSCTMQSEVYRKLLSLAAHDGQE